MKFRKSLMVKRLKALGLESQITPEIVAKMDNFDGCDAIENCWDRRVHGAPVLWCTGKDGTSDYVNEADCN